MTITTLSRAMLVALALLVVGTQGLSAQRRRTGSGTPSTGRTTPSRQGSPGTTRGRAGRPTVEPGRRGTASGGAARAPEPVEAGKIGAVRDQAGRARIPTSRGVIVVSGVWLGSCFDCDYWGWRYGYWGWYHAGWWYPAYYPRWHRPYDDEDEDYGERSFGQTYLPYPYADGARHDAFAQSGVPGRRSFGTATGQFFDDRTSTTRAGRFALEGGVGLFRGALAYDQYYERPAAGRVDRLHSFRGSLGVQPRLGTRGYLIAGVGVRGLALDSGGTATGPEGELGLQVFPFRPLGANVTARLASLSWNGYDRFTVREVTTTGSIFFGRVEVQAGWHWMRVGDAPAFEGPVVGTRLWF
jgi:hypothetical protein